MKPAWSGFFTGLFAALSVVACSSKSNGNGVVIACNSSQDCPKNLPMCAPDSKICVGCLTSMITCGPKLMCDEATRTCVPADLNAPCTGDNECPLPGRDPLTSVRCLLDAGACVQCVLDTDCVQPDTCIDNHCGQLDAGVEDAP